MENYIPNPDSIPVHWGWFQVLLTFTFILHLVLMNLVLGGSILLVWDRVIRKNRTAGQSSLPVLIALAINLGVPPLLFLQVMYGHFFYSSSVIMAVPWLLVIPVLIAAYYASYIYNRKWESHSTWAGISLALSTLLILYVGFMQVNNATLSVNPGGWLSYFDRPGGFNLNLSESSLLPRYLHFLLSALSVAALGIALYARYSGGDDSGAMEQVTKMNLRRFAWFTILQFAIGTWFWLSHPKEIFMTFMGGSMVATILMMLSLLMSVSMVISAFRNKLKTTLFHLLPVLLFMVIIREYLRAAELKGIFHPSSLEVTGQSSPMAVFLLVFIAGLFCLYYMFRLATKKS